MDLLSFGERLAIDLWQEEDYLRRRGECSSEMDQNPEHGEAHCPCCGAIVTTEFRYRDSDSIYRFSYRDKSVIVHETSARKPASHPCDAFWGQARGGSVRLTSVQNAIQHAKLEYMRPWSQPMLG